MADDPSAQAQAQAAQPRERERAAVRLLARLHGPRELHAALLVLLLPADSLESLSAWEAEIDATPDLLALPEQALNLSGATRLPCFELLLTRMAKHPVAARQAVLESTRRVMRARGSLRPIDRLHWLTMRLRLGDRAFFGARTTAADDPSLLPESDVRAIARYSAYLARMVPGDAGFRGDGPDNPNGTAWYASVMAPWHPHGNPPDAAPPDADGLVQALQELQALAWTHRPVLVRGWVLAAVAHSRHGQLGDAAADALRLSCGLLDSPLPPELARHYSAALEVRR